MIVEYTEVVKFLESLQIMPKTMPGLNKIKLALEKTVWFQEIDPNKIIVVAGTNGKGSTCAALESLLFHSGQKVGFYSSPHLVSTTERIRANLNCITEDDFVLVFNECIDLIKKFELSHFEALTLMAGHYFFSSKWGLNLDFAIFEVGLGGSFDATNAFAHKYNIITKLGLDHVNILGSSLVQIAENKFGIVQKKGLVVHHPIPLEVYELKQKVQKITNSNWVEADSPNLIIKKTENNRPRYFLNYNNSKFEINLLGARAAENIMTAIAAFQVLGFDLRGHEEALNKIQWSGRMQAAKWPGLKCPLYLSGDHNLQGIESLLEILKDFKWKSLHLVVGIGIDKDADQMFKALLSLENVKLYLTETPFKGRNINDYPETYLKISSSRSANPQKLLNEIANVASAEDLCVVTGSLYLVGEILKAISI